MRAFGLALLMVLSAGRVDAQREETWAARRRAHSVTLRIEASRPEYHSGDSVRVRVTLINTSGQLVKLLRCSVDCLAPLWVYDESGIGVPLGLQLAGGWGGGPDVDLEGKEEVTLTDYEYFCAGDKSPSGDCHASKRNLSQWILLDNWGYHLTTPGRYTIVGPTGVGPMSNGRPNWPPDSTARSNWVAISILP